MTAESDKCQDLQDGQRAGDPERRQCVAGGGSGPEALSRKSLFHWFL